MQSVPLSQPEPFNSSADTVIKLPVPSRASELNAIVVTIILTERVYARPGPVWRMMGELQERSEQVLPITTISDYLTARHIPEEYWVNYRQTIRGDFIENARVIPFSHLSPLTQERYRELAGSVRGAVIALGENIGLAESIASDESVSSLVNNCIDEIANTFRSFDEAIKRSLTGPQPEANLLRGTPTPDRYCMSRAIKLFEAIARDHGIFENQEAASAFQAVHDRLSHERFSRFGNTELPKLFGDILRQHGERPTPFLRDDPDLYDFFRRGMNDLGSLPESKSSNDDPLWYTAVLQKISPLIPRHTDPTTSSRPTFLERPETQSGSRSFVGIIKDNEKTPLAVIKIAAGPDRLEEILSEAILDQGDERTVLPFSWGRFGDGTFFALYPVAGERDEDQRFVHGTQEPHERSAFVSQLGEIIADQHVSSGKTPEVDRPLLSRYRDIAQRVYNLSYDSQVLGRRLEGAPLRLSGKVEGIISAYRQALVFQPETFSTGAVHGDLYPSNIFVNGDRYRIIDNNQAAYYRGRVMSTGDPAKDVGQSIGYLLVQWARRHEGGYAPEESGHGDTLEELMNQLTGLLSSYLTSREEKENPVTERAQFVIGAAFHACCFASKNWTDIKGVKFTSLEGGPPTDAMRDALFGALESFLDGVSIPPLIQQSPELSQFWRRPGR